jgi:hypothetical protein
LVGGINYPVEAAVGGFALCLARLLFIGYIYEGGPKNAFRITGALLADIALIYLFVLSVMSCSKYM